MSNPGRNIKFALRQLWKSPGFTIVAVLIFALGIGANTAIFSVVNGVLLEPLPFRNPDRLVQLWHTPPQSSFPGINRFAISAANFLDWQKQNHVFEEMTLYTFRGFDLSGTGKPESLRSGAVTSSFFSVLGVQPLYGRVFTSDEDQPGRNHVAILTYRIWKQRYGADPGVIGRTMNLDGTAYQIVGVMGPRMTRPDFAQIWTPLGLTPQEAAVRGEHHYLAMARLKPGVTLSQAQNEMNTISHRLEVQYPADDKGWGAEVISLRDSLVGDVRPALLMMLGAVGFVLLIACANVANLMLGRAFARRKEIAIRTALGASRAGVIRLLVIECLIVALAGGALGLYTAHFGIDLLIKFFADKLPRMGDIGLNGTVLLF
ncbi:MAG TPA: ABC transporter permease, partial [Acidobacteriaceae bacterium]|nr:ABC transporter permease [Acidobacteriaceae bacterium]